MENFLMEFASGQGLGYLMFVFLFLWTIKKNNDRELRYQKMNEKNQEIISCLSKDIKSDLEDIKAELRK